MKNSSRPAKTLERETEVYRAFLGLDHRHRRRLAVRILRNQRVLNDLYDHLLIEQSLREPAVAPPGTLT